MAQRDMACAKGCFRVYRRYLAGSIEGILSSVIGARRPRDSSASQRGAALTVDCASAPMSAAPTPTRLSAFSIVERETIEEVSRG